MGDAAEKRPDDAMMVTMTRGDLKGLLREVVQEALEGAKVTATYLDVDEAARHFNVDPRTIRNWCAAGAPHARAGREYRIQLVEFQRWANDRAKKLTAVK